MAANCHELTDETVGLYFGVSPYRDSLLYFNKRADEAIVADLTFIQINGLNDFRVQSKPNVSDASLDYLRVLIRRHRFCTGLLSKGIMQNL